MGLVGGDGEGGELISSVKNMASSFSYICLGKH